MNKYTYRHLARIIVEAASPLSVGSGEGSILTDKLVARDVNGVPYIPGTSIAGVVRILIDNDIAKEHFGCQDKGKGSNVIFSSAHIVYSKEHKIIEYIDNSVEEDAYLKEFKILPIRDHVRIDSRGVSENRGKFDEEVVYKGTRFCFEIEILSETIDDPIFNQIKSVFGLDTFRLGSGTRSGFGELRCIECKYRCLDLSAENDLQVYINKTSSLNDSFWSNIVATELPPKTKSEDVINYTLTIKPENLFLFSASTGESEIGIGPVTETVVVWEKEKAPAFKKYNILIPASSVKGALSHRVAFEYNLLMGYFAGDENAKVSDENPAVKALFGGASTKENIKRGNVLISDVFGSSIENRTHTLNHVSIDQFTGGAINGALFSENVAFTEECFILKLSVNTKNVIDKDGKIVQALENALLDIATGMLPLGGGVNRGHGVFFGKVENNDNCKLEKKWVKE